MGPMFQKIQFEPERLHRRCIFLKSQDFLPNSPENYDKRDFDRLKLNFRIEIGKHFLNALN